MKTKGDYRKCDYPGCGDGGYYGTYYFKAGKKVWGVFCYKHEQEVIRERAVALQEAMYRERPKCVPAR